MAVVNSKSPIIANFDAQPRIVTSGYLAGAAATVCKAVITTAVTDSVGSTYRYGFIPSGVSIQDIQIQNDPTGGAWQLGVYCNTQQLCRTVTGGVVTIAQPGAMPIANANLIFGTGILTGFTEVTWKSVYSPTILAAPYTAGNATLRVWELLGLDADPDYIFHLVLTCTTAPTSVGNIALQWQWVK